MNKRPRTDSQNSSQDQEGRPSDFVEEPLGDKIRKRKEKKAFKEKKLLEVLEKKHQKKISDKPSAIFESQKTGRNWTLSIALPGSILDNAQSPELRAYLAGQIARAAAVFSVDEIIIFNDSKKSFEVEEEQDYQNEEENGGGEEEFQGLRKKNSAVQLARILQYLECPQYLRKHFFPIHSDLKYAGILNPTDMPHHLRNNEDGPGNFREGIVLDKECRKEGHSLVGVGTRKDVIVAKTITPGVRVTVKLARSLEDDALDDKKNIKGSVVSPSAPRTELGVFWGYSVRLVQKLSEVFTGNPFSGRKGPKGYDLVIGTSERGVNIDDFEIGKENKNFSNALIVFGGVKGLEAAVDADDAYEAGRDPSELFQHYLNTCPIQGSRTIRTEEAVIITLAGLRPKIVKKL